MNADLVAHGRVMRIETRGRRSGEPRTATIGFVEAADGSFLVAATPGSHWGENLLVDPACRVTVATARSRRSPRRSRAPTTPTAIRELILRYGTPSEGLGRGPSFRLVPVQEDRG